jgi:hypothetical protein
MHLIAPTVREAADATESGTGKLVWLLFAVVPIVVAGQGSGMGLVDPWWNFALGKLMLARHQLVVVDPFSFTPAATGVINQQWLAQLAWAMAYSLAGPPGAFVLRGFAVATTATCLWFIGRQLLASRRALAGASLLSTCLIASNLGIRAQTLAFPIAALSLWALQRGGRAKWLAVPLSIVWANVHGSFPLAVAFPAAFALGSVAVSARRQAFQYAAITLATAVGTLITPYGPEVWRYAIEMSSNDAMRSVLSEWAPTTTQTLTGKAFFVELGVGLLIVARWRPRLPVTWIILGIGLTAFGITAVRNVVWLGLVGIPVWAMILDRSFDNLADHKTRRRTVCLMAIVLMAITLVPLSPVSIGGPIPSGGDVATPSQAKALDDLGNYLRDHPKGLLFHDADWGAYLEAHVGPAQQVFIDTRFEVHPTSVWDDYFAVVSGRYDWQAILDRYGVERVAVDPSRTPILAQALDGSSNWQKIWLTGDDAEPIVVWQRAGPGTTVE